MQLPDYLPDSFATLPLTHPHVPSTAVTPGHHAAHQVAAGPSAVAVPSLLRRHRAARRAPLALH